MVPVRSHPQDHEGPGQALSLPALPDSPSTGHTQAPWHFLKHGQSRVTRSRVTQ